MVKPLSGPQHLTMAGSSKWPLEAMYERLRVESVWKLDPEVEEELACSIFAVAKAQKVVAIETRRYHLVAEFVLGRFVAQLPSLFL